MLPLDLKRMRLKEADGDRGQKMLRTKEKQAGEEKQTDLVAIVKSQSWHV